MAFQFVNSTLDDKGEYSAETRRRIRSQAMRDYRRRQRTEGSDIESSPEPSPPSSSASPPVKSACQSSQVSSRRQSNSQSLRVQSVNLRRHSSETSSDNPPFTEAAQAARGKRRNTGSPLEGETPRSAQRRRRDVPRAQHGVFSQFMINLPKQTTPPAIEEDLDQLNSAADLGQMLDACEEYNTWLHSSKPPDVPASKQNNAAYDDKTSQMLLCALSLKSVGQLEAVQSAESKVDKNLLKTRVLALLNKRLKDPNKALENNTIGALACLASYEMSQGSQEATMHLSGLQQILHLRGGTRKVGSTAGLTMLLEILDLTHAVYFHTAPMYTVAEPSPQPSSHEQTPTPPSRPDEGSAGELDQEILDDISNFILSVPDLAEMGTGAEKMSQITGAGQYMGLRNEVEEEVEVWERLLRTSAGRIEMDPEGSAEVARTCRMAADLHLVAMSPVRAHPVRVRAMVEQLFEVLRALDEESWEGWLVLHVRVLLTALTTSLAPQQRAWYHAQLTRRLYQVEAEDWPSVKGVVIRFLEMLAAVRRRPAPRGVHGLGVGVEVVC